MKTAVVIGATGLVGGHLVEQLEKNPAYRKVVVLSRRNVKYNNSKVEVRVIDFDNPDSTQIAGDDIYCAIGTTIKKAGSKENQYRIDCEYPARLAEIAKANGAEKFILVSSIGANSASGNFYLRTKGDLEERLKRVGFNSLIILRPSFILGDRKEFRPGEKIGIVVAKILAPFMVGGLRKYRGVHAQNIAKRMVNSAQEDTSQITIISSESI